VQSRAAFSFGVTRDMQSPFSPDPDALARDAFALLQRNQHQAAEACARQALALRPGHSDALNACAIALNGQSRHAEAARIFQELTRRAPAERTHWVNLGTTLRATGQYDEALAAYTRAAQLGAASANFSYNVGLLHMDRGDYESARAVLARAAALAPDDAEIRFQYANCCYETVRMDEALAAIEPWPTFGGLTPELMSQIALLLLNLGEPQKAAQAAQRARTATTPSPETALRLIQVGERTNQLAEARSALNELVADPRAASLGSDLALVRAQLAQREGHHEEACELFRECLSHTAELHRRHYHLFPLAKSLDALGRYDEAFATLVDAHRSQGALLTRTAPEATSRRTPPMVIASFGCDAADVANWDHSGAPPVEASPVFIVAFPRSGTTLLEQTLDAHPTLRTMDEQPYLQNAIDVLRRHKVDYPAALAQATAGQLEEARAKYWELTRRKVQLAPGQRLLDKNPLNLLRLPAIRRLFPRSPIVLAVRHPCDVILSCFMQHFRAPEFAWMCRDLPTLALGWRRAFDFWYQQQALLGPAVHEIRYETFVADFAPQVRALSEFLELPWNDAMLAPAEHARSKGFISTPSYSQVIQPVHGRSVGRWKRYEARFADVIPQIEPYLKRWGYP
jgi:tetratricopeptide (TPR) repeat protein